MAFFTGRGRFILLAVFLLFAFFTLLLRVGNVGNLPSPSAWRDSFTGEKQAASVIPPEMPNRDLTLYNAVKTKQEFFCALEKEMSPKNSSKVVEIPARPDITPGGFKMHVYPSNDIVSDVIMRSKSWDATKTSLLLHKLQELQRESPGKKITFLDIGANVGWFTLSAAAAGFDVIAVEPMLSNHMLLRPSICANEGLSDRITLYDVGLNDKKERCFVFSGKDNVGDGTTACSTDPNADKNWNPNPDQYRFRQYMDVSTLDHVMQAHVDKQTIGLMKMDVEGFEPWVLKGGMEFFSNKAVRPRFIFTEFSPAMMNMNPKKGNPLEFLQTWDKLGYNVFKDSWTTGQVHASQFKSYVDTLPGGAIVDLHLVAREI